VQVPKINDSQFQDLLEEAKALVPFYTREWKATDGKTPGVALLKLFAHMQETVIRRLNRVPDKNFIAFLDMLGIKLLPAQPARAPVTFSLSEGAAENVLIPERTQAAAGELIFETEKNILAAHAKLVQAYSLSISKDEIFKSPSNVIDGKAVSPFSAHLAYKAKSGEKDLFLDDVSGLEKGDILKIGEAEYVMVSEVSDTKVSIVDELRHEHEATTPVTKVTVFELFEGRNRQEHILYLGHKDLFHIKPVSDSPSNLVLQLVISEAAQPNLPLEWSYWGEDKETKKDRWIVTPVTPVGYDIPVVEIYGIGPTFAQRLQAANINIVGELLKYTPQELMGILKTNKEYRVENILTAARNKFIEASRRDKTQVFEAAGIDGTSGLIKDGDITLPISSQIKETEVHGVKSRWLRCKVKGPVLKNTKLPAVDTISVRIQNTLTPDMAFYNDVPLDLTLDEQTKNFKENLYPFGKKPRLFDTFYLGSGEVFSKKGASITLSSSISAGYDIPIVQILGIGPTFARRLQAANINTVGQLFKYTPRELMGILKTNKEYRVENILTAARDKFVEASRRTKEQMSGAAGKGKSASSQEELTLSWEYWNGKGWVVIKDLDDRTGCFLKDGVVIFSCPSDIEPTQVGGQENYWIRVRIVSGDYGKEIVYDKKKEDWVSGEITPPLFSQLTLTYSLEPQKVEHCLTYNNLEFVNNTEESKISGKPFQPFQPLDDEHQTLYLGFDKKLESGPISIFFSIEEPEYVEETMPRIVWECFAERGKSGGWVRLEVLDGTRNLTRSGTVEFIVPSDFAAFTKFGKELYWIRAVDVEDRFQPYIVKAHILPEFRKYEYEASIEESLKEGAIEPCPPSHLVVFHPLWTSPPEARKYPPNPRIEGIYLNTTWAMQVETIKDEIMGSSNGGVEQTFTLTKIPVTSEEIWVNELNALSEEEMKDIVSNGEFEVKEVQDEKGNTAEFWIKWQAVDDLLGSAKGDRHYEIDRISGNVRFGDGINGAIPPIGVDNIKADYRSGGGKNGNVGSLKLTALKTSIPFVDRVSNPVAAAGGSDTEVLERALERGPQTVRHRNRAVTNEDFEWLAKQASPGIARAKCLPNFDDRGEHKPGWVTLLIVPRSEEEQPKPSLDLKSRVETYLKDHSANTVVSPEHLQVSEPVYVEVGVEATIIATSMDEVPLVENETFSQLKEFLHPLTGGYEREGWDFGKAPCLSDFFALLEKIPGVNYVKSLLIRVKASEKQIMSELVITPEKPGDIEMPPYTLVFSGEHKITVTFEKES